MSGDYILYRLRDTAGDLLYVGATTQPIRHRLRHHSLTQPWWSQVADYQTEPCLDAETLASAEQAAIRAELPRFNIRHATRDKGRRRTGLGPQQRLREALGNDEWQFFMCDDPGDS